MEDNNQQMHDNKSTGAYCNCMNCRGGHRHMLIRLILGLIILAIVFCLGVKIGEFKGEFGGQGRHGFYGQRGMMGYPNIYQGSQNGYYMMGTKFNQAVPPPQGAANSATLAQPVK